MPSPLRKLPRAALIYGLGDALPKAASILLLPVLTRLLSPGEYGVVSAVSAFALVLTLLLHLSLQGALFRFYHDCRNEAERRVLFGTLLLFAVGWSLALVVGLNLAGGFFLDGLYRSVRFEPYLRLATWLALFSSLPALPLAVLQAQQRPLLYRTLTFASFLLTTGGTLFFLLVVRRDAYGALMGQTTGAALAAVLYLYAVRRHLTPGLSGPVLRACLAFSLPLAAYSVGGWLVDSANRVFVERYLGVTELGLFNVASQIALGLGFLLNTVGLAFSPLFYETARSPSGPRQLAEFGRLYVVATAGVTLTLAVFAPELLRVLAEPRYQRIHPILPVLLLTQSLTCVWHLVANPVFLKNRTGALALFSMSAALFAVVLNLWLVPQLGTWGAALAPLGAGILLNASVFVFSARLYPVPHDYRALVLTVVGAAAVYALTRLVHFEERWLSIGSRVLLLVAYPLLLVSLDVLKPARLHEGFTWIRRQISA